jgi:hypothetical protein
VAVVVVMLLVALEPLEKVVDQVAVDHLEAQRQVQAGLEHQVKVQMVEHLTMVEPHGLEAVAAAHLLWV